MKGKMFLKVTGILMIIGGAFGIIGGFVALIGASALAAVLETSAGGLVFSSVLILASNISADCRNYGREKLRKARKGAKLPDYGCRCGNFKRSRKRYLKCAWQPI